MIQMIQTNNVSADGLDHHSAGQGMASHVLTNNENVMIRSTVVSLSQI